MEMLINILFVVVVVWFAYTRLGPAKGLRTLRIDVREAAEFLSGHIPGARNVPLSQLGSRLGELPKERPLLLYCRNGMRSKTAARLLRRGGYTQLTHLQGGLGAWGGKLE
ncbi:rhodanese-like domain-containing protein [Paenibacillus silvisoli]|uniref:rhodanese-like domain-containing protein n=1 Tax=Paenibacillus silvisoli TaxID=3110539 RepID=UPI0028043DD7|nr:rhodanese-like domain-containing protein [Paenibacillus silvisoli]